MRKLLVLLFLLLPSGVWAFPDPPLLTVTKPSGSTHTVCDSGCDFATLEAADGNVSAGDTIQVKAGTYTAGVNWNQDGTAGNEIVIEAFGGGDAIFMPSTNAEAMDIHGDYVILDGGANRELVFDGTNSTTNVVLYLHGSNITVSRVEVRNQGACTAATLLKGNTNRVYNSVVHDGEGEGIYFRDGDDHEVRNNIIYNNRSGGIQFNPHVDVEEVNRALVAGNAIYGNGVTACDGDRGGVQVYLSSRAGYTIDDVVIKNNLIWGNQLEGISVRAENGTMTNIDIYNNTIYNNGRDGIRNYNANGAILTNNIIYGNSGDALNLQSGASWVSTTTNTTSADPGFVSTTVADADYLKINASSSNTYNSGTAISEAAFGTLNDYAGTDRPQASTWDIGAYEHDAGGGDVAVPVFDNGTPTGAQTEAVTVTGTVPLYGETDELAQCKYDTSSGVAYASMSGQYDSSNTATDAMTHNKTLTINDWDGTHDGAGNAAILTDSGESWPVDGLIGYDVYNLTDGSECEVTDNDATTATCTLAGGTDNDWDAADAYSMDRVWNIYTRCQDDEGTPNVSTTDYTTTFVIAASVPPRVASHTPATDATDVNVDADVVVYFTDVMDSTTIDDADITTGNVTICADTGQDGCDGANVGGAATYTSAGRYVTINPSGSLSNSQDYKVTLTTSVTDSAGNALTATGGLPLSWYFTTAAAVDATPPVITHYEPFPTQTDVPINTNVILCATDNDGIDASRYSFIFGDVTVSPIPQYVAADSELTVTDNSAFCGGTGQLKSEFNPASDLSYNTTYFVGAIVYDDTGNVASGGAYVFTTVADSTAPYIGNLVPLSGATDVSRTTTVTLCLYDVDSDVDPSTISVSVNSVAYTVDHNKTTYDSDHADCTDGAVTGDRMVITPTATLPANTSITVSPSFDDNEGNSYAGGNYSFTTIAGTAGPYSPGDYTTMWTTNCEDMPEECRQLKFMIRE